MFIRRKGDPSSRVALGGRAKVFLVLVSGLPYKFRNTLFVVRHVESCERIKDRSKIFGNNYCHSE